ncbi:MAG: ATP-binding protein [Pirellulales bacterium]
MTPNSPPPTDGETHESESKSQASDLVEIAKQAELFADPHDERAYASIEVNGHRETWAVRSKQFRAWLGETFYRLRGRAINSAALHDAINVVTGMALYDGSQWPVYVRVAGDGGRIYLDLCDDRWQVVEVASNGWHAIESRACPVRFTRRRGMLPLPEPQRGGSVDDLRPLINVASDADWRVLVAFMVACLRPQGPYPVLAVNGEQGSAKSTLSRMVRGVIDPNVSPLRRPPKGDRDLMIAATNSWITAFDNLSGVSANLSDALCSLTTGGGFATRELHTDDEEKLFTAQRPVLLNGIDEVATRPDLLDRAICLTLPVIPPHQRQDEESLRAQYERLRPGILGALLDAVSAALLNLPNVRLSRSPRMADFAKWATAAEPGLKWKGGAFMAAYDSNREAANDLAIEASVTGSAVLALMSRHHKWEGTSGEILAEIEKHHASPAQRARQGWPRSPKAMSQALRRLAPNLRAAGIEYHAPTPQGKDRRRILILEKVTSQLFAPFTSSATAGLELPRVDVPHESEPTADGQADAPPPHPPPSTQSGTVGTADASAADETDEPFLTQPESEISLW